MAGVREQAPDSADARVALRTCDRIAACGIYTGVSASSFQLDLPQGLIARACAGELGAFEQIYRRFERPVFNLAYRVMVA